MPTGTSKELTEIDQLIMKKEKKEKAAKEMRWCDDNRGKINTHPAKAEEAGKKAVERVGQEKSAG